MKNTKRFIQLSPPLSLMCLGLHSLCIACPLELWAQQPTTSADNSSSNTYTIQTSVRRVVVDVVVTDAQGNPKRGLARNDFSVEEDGKPQAILSFDVHDKDSWNPVLPATIPANTFVNLPRQPEQGPLYVLFYDMVNTGDVSPINADTSVNMIARRQLEKFVKSKPEGTRFALLVLSDGLHLVQGFTADKQKLFAALDPDGHVPHMPKVFLYSGNYNFGDKFYYVSVMKEIARYLDGLPGRKNVIWVSRTFPFAVFPTQGPPDLVEKTRKELAVLAADQIAIYPIDAQGCCGLDLKDLTEDEVASETGGRAFYNGNDLAGSIMKAVGDGETYYTLSYASTNQNYNGKLRHIEVKVFKPRIQLAYRHQYYADPGPSTDERLGAASAASLKRASPSPPPDTLLTYLRHGMPESHDLLFSASVDPDGKPKLATPEQMATLSGETISFGKRVKAALSPLIPLQTYTIEYGVPARQFRTQSPSPNTVELAAAAYDADGNLLNKMVSHSSLPRSEQSRPYFAEQQFDVPVNASWMCVAIRDVATGRIGNVEFALPLAPKSPSAVPH